MFQISWKTKRILQSKPICMPSRSYHAQLTLLALSHRRRQWYPTPVLLPGKSHGRRSLVDWSPWGRKESDSTSLSLFTFMHWRRKWQSTPVFLPGESQGRGAWWAAIYGVSQSRIRLKWLSSSSSSSFITHPSISPPVYPPTTHPSLPSTFQLHDWVNRL